VLPIHRAVSRDRNWNFNDFLERLADNFEVLDLPAAGLSPPQIVAHLENQVQYRQSAERVAFGMLGPDPGRAFLVEVPVPVTSGWPWPEHAHPSWRTLATAVFETGILRAVLGYSDEQIDAGTGMEFTKDSSTLIEWVRTGRYQLGFILPATSLASIFEVARLGQNLPRKSTFFFPKLLTGLTIHRMEPVPSK
jgi:hypothetical protein